MAEDNDNNLRPLMSSSMDFEFLMADPRWGRDEVTKGLQDKLKKYKYYVDTETQEWREIEDKLWNILAFYTKDIRQGYLSENNNEMANVRFWLIYAGDLLAHNYKSAFISALSRAVAVIETSQSKNGFFTKMKNTLRKEETHTEIEPPKKKFFGGGKNGEY